MEEQQQRRDRAVVSHEWEIMDTAAFDHMMRWATMMARAAVLPYHLKVFRREDNSLILDITEALKDEPKLRFFLDVEATTANCALIVTQAVQWRVHPFLLAQVTYMTRGKIGYEGKMIQAVIERVCGNLDVEYQGEGDKLKATISGHRPGDGKKVSTEGTFAEWATKVKDGTGKAVSPQWSGGDGQKRKMMRYRGVREWAREHSPGLMLGVISDDELEDMQEDYRARRAVQIDHIPSAAPALTHQPVEQVIPDQPRQRQPEPVAASGGLSDEARGIMTREPNRDGSAPAVVEKTAAEMWNLEQSNAAITKLKEDLAVAQTREDALDCFNAFSVDQMPRSLVQQGEHLTNERLEALAKPTPEPANENATAAREAVIAEAKTWVERMRKIKTVPELEAFEREVISAIVLKHEVVSKGGIIPDELLIEAASTYEARLKLLNKSKPKG